MVCSLRNRILCVLGMVFCVLAFNPQASFSQDTLSTLEPTDGVTTITITMESYEYTPQTLTAEVGKPIKFLLKNESFLVPHNFLLDSPNGNRLVEVNVDSGEEAVVDFTPTQAGIYLFYCDKQLLFFPNHREEGMEGTLTVQ